MSLNSTSTQDPANSQPSPGPVNFMLLLYEAINKDQNSMSQQQILDAKTAEMAVQFEEGLYSYWNNELGEDAQNILLHPDQVQYYNDIYQSHSAQAQSAESQQDGSVQSDQGQTSSDAQNLQTKAGMVQGINTILSTLSSLLGRITA